MFRRLTSGLLKTTISSSVLGLSLLSAAGAADKSAAQPFRLPNSVAPISYTLFVEPHPEDAEFTGSESIEFQTREPTDRIVLNSVDIKIKDAECRVPATSDSSRVTGASGGLSKPTKLKVRYQTESEMVVLELPHKIASGRYVVSMSFHGKLNDKLKGFFRTSFVDAGGTKHWLSATQMEPTDARRMFPCMDEPQYKASFKISTSIDAEDTAISNAPILKETTDTKTKRKIVTFEESPKMSTYLVALVVGRFVPTEAITVKGVPIRVWCTPGKEKLSHFSQELASRLLKYYDQYFDVDYPAKKLDLIAIPDFSNGAMENLGAATFREDLLLVDEKHGSLAAKQQVAINVAHEMAHMWFGDLVTMKWWDDLWLNEAFAEWMSTKAIDKMEPGWHYWNQFALERDQSMLSDSLRATRSIHLDVTGTDQIEQMFDEITYQKGASVLRMLERFVTEDKFRDGIRHYIKGHEYANATGEDLWSAISAQSGKDVSGIMHSWVYQEGYPVISMASSNSSNTQDAQLAISQNRFTFKRSQQGPSTAPQWEIPVEVRTLDSAQPASQKFLITSENTELPEASKSPQVINAGGEGYYRVKYDAETLRQLASRMNKLTVLERAAILSDQFNLALSGQTPVADYLKFTRAYRDEKDPAVTSVMCTEISQLDLMIDESSRAAFAEFVRDRLSNAKSSLGWTSRDGDSDLVKGERAELMLTLGTLGQDRETIEEARELTEKIFANDSDTSIDAELFDPALKIVAYNGNATDYAKIESLWQRSKSPEHQESALMALTMFREPTLMHKTLKMCLTDKVRRQDAPQVIAALMDTREGRGVTWEFVRKHIIRLAWRLSGERLFNIVMAMNSLSTEQQLSEVQAFFRKHPVPSQSRGINKIIEAIQVRVAFRQREGAALHSWLATNAKPTQTIQISHR